MKLSVPGCVCRKQELLARSDLLKFPEIRRGGSMRAKRGRRACKIRLGALLALALMAPFRGAQGSEEFHRAVQYYKLPNGLRVVLSPDHTAPTVCVGVYYRIGFRIEPRDRTGFAHLFEHMMFQGSKNLGKMEFIKLVQANGGILNGSTRFDFTNYFRSGSFLQTGDDAVGRGRPDERAGG